MTREEAIKVLENPDVSIGASTRIGQDPEYWRKLRPALDMAISALRHQDVTDKNVGKMTNADRIRAMSDKELAELMRSMMDCDSCGNMFSFKCDGSYEHCLSVCLKWLQKPAEEDDMDLED